MLNLRVLWAQARAICSEGLFFFTDFVQMWKKGNRPLCTMHPERLVFVAV